LKIEEVLAEVNFYVTIVSTHLLHNVYISGIFSSSMCHFLPQSFLNLFRQKGVFTCGFVKSFLHLIFFTKVISENLENNKVYRLSYK